MRRLKDALVTAPALKPLVYVLEEDGFVGGVVLRVDACGGSASSLFYSRRIGTGRGTQ
jgi:hypothetical protein